MKPPKVVWLRPPRIQPANPAKKKPPPKTHYAPTHRGGDASGPPADRNVADPDSIRAAWTGLRTFGHHVDFECRTGLRLNGKPITLDELMIFTNRIHKMNGLPQVGKKPEWKV
jgi:hypothetical protein